MREPPGSLDPVLSNDRKAQGVLTITLQWHNPQQGQALLAALAG